MTEVTRFLRRFREYNGVSLGLWATQLSILAEPYYLSNSFLPRGLKIRALFIEKLSNMVMCATMLHTSPCCVSFFGWLFCAFCPILTRFWRVFDPLSTIFWIYGWGSSNGFGQTGVYEKPTLSTFQRNWPCVILISVQETATSRSREVGLISAFKMVFPSFLVRILISLAMLLMNRKNLLVEEVAFFENALDFWKLMVRIGKILCAKVVCRIAIVGNFSALCFFLGRFPAFGWPISRCRI